MPVLPSLSERYHEATKYTPEGIRSLGRANLANQPPPFKAWVQSGRIGLTGRSHDDPAGSSDPLDAERLGRLLHHTYGVTRIWQSAGHALYLRAAPSAGGLYPTELYVATFDVDGIPNGIHAYHGAEHTLITCWEGDFRAEFKRFTFGAAPVEDAQAILIGTGYYARSSWRYSDRAYRRVLLDAGHMFGNAVLAGHALDIGVTLLPDFHDDGIGGLLLLDPAQEGTLLLAALRPGPCTSVHARRRAEAAQPMERQPEDISGVGTWIPLVHRAGDLDSEDALLPPAPSVPDAVDAKPTETAAIHLAPMPLGPGEAVLRAIRVRRSTRAYEASALPAEALSHILASGYPPAGGQDPITPLAPGLLATYVLVAGVYGMPPGVYRYDGSRHALTALRRHPIRSALHRACLGQELGRDAAFSVIHTFSMPEALTLYGDRAYRHAHLEAGLIGQRLNLAAARQGFGASGIGGFFDDAVNAILGLSTEHAIAYITTIGVPE